MGEKGRFGYFPGIDISKETFDGCCIKSQGEEFFSLSTSMDRKAFEELIKQLSSLSFNQESVLIGMESTSRLHVTIYPFLARQSVR